MLGNVWEWCLRGGSWSTFCRSATRDEFNHRDIRSYIFGFRIAETVRPTLLAEEMQEAELPPPHKDMILSEVVEYLENLQTKDEKEKFITAIYWSGARLDNEDDQGRAPPKKLAISC